MTATVSTTRERIRNKRRKLAEQIVQFLGDDVTIREIGALDRVNLFSIVTTEGGKQNAASVLRMNCHLLSKSAFDGDTPLMTADEWLELANSELDAVLALGMQAMNLNKMSGESIEVTAKNSAASLS